MTYKKLLSELKDFTSKELEQEVMVECTLAQVHADGESFLVNSFKEFKVVDTDSSYWDRKGQIYLE